MKYIFGLLCLFSCLYAQAQTGLLKGTVQNQSGETLPFATIYIQSLQRGTTSNEEGNYQMNLPYGTYEITCRYLGYKLRTQRVTISSKVTQLNIQLQSETLTLEGVTIDDSEDPAYRIIRNARQHRKKHLHEIEAYTCEAYVKGLNRIDKIPKMLKKRAEELDTGIVYLSESVSKIQYRKPDYFSEKMIASKVSGKSKAFSFNRATGAKANFYKNLVGTDFTERGMVSPIATSCFLYYDYELLGASYEDGLLINKIKVTPKQKSSPTFDGIIYIIEGSWRIYALQLDIIKGKIDFLNNLSIKQTYQPIDGSWVMATQKFDFDFSVLGIEGSGYFLNIYQKYVIFKPTTSTQKKKAKNEIFKIEEGANKKDSTYWEKIRPVPLTKIETKDYTKKDSIEVIKNDPAYRDSVLRATNKITPSKILIGGLTLKDPPNNRWLRFDPLIKNIQYNTVEGTVTQWGITYSKSYDNEKKWDIEPKLKYGFGNTRLNAQVKIGALVNPLKSEVILLRGGRFTSQINYQEPIMPLINSAYTLLDHHNYMKIYQKDFVSIFHQKEWVNGLTLIAFVNYAQRSPLYNLENFRGEKAHPHITPNAPTNVSLPSTDFETHESFRYGLIAKIVFKQKYMMTTPYTKVNQPSKYPTLQLSYKRAAPIFGANMDHEYLEALISYDFKIGLLGTSTIKARGGLFSRSSEMPLIDYKHFGGNQTLLLKNDSWFQLLPYYRYSTRDPYFATHYTHHFNGYFLNGLPLIKRLKLQEVFTLSYLHTKYLNHYLELGVGIEHIFKIGRLDAYWSFEEGRQRDFGLRIGIGF